MANKISDLQRRLAQSKSGKEKIRGKEYSTVPLRVELFRQHVDAADIGELSSIYTSISILDDNKVVAKAYLAESVDVIIDENGSELVQMKGVKSVGTAEEFRASSSVNQTSAVENAETSAVGRMLGLLGLHGGKMASAEEVRMAEQARTVVEFPKVSQQRVKAIDTASEFAERARACKSKQELNQLLIDRREFFEMLQSKSEEEYQELRGAMQNLRNSLPEQSDTEE